MQVRSFGWEEDLEEEVFEEAPAPSQLAGQLENAEGKRKRLIREGALLAEAERFAEALSHYEEALQLTDSPVEQACILEQMSQVMLALDRDFDAVRLAERAVECRGDWWCAHLTLGRALLNFGEMTRAVETLRMASTLVDCSEGAEEVAAELADAQRLLEEAQRRATVDPNREVVVNGRIVQSRFWETALRVTYDEQGQGTTHYGTRPG